MKTIVDIFKEINLDPKEASVYTILLELGPTAIRKIAEKSKVNRGSVYEALKKLQKIGLVSYFHKGKRQHFVAESPQTLSKIVARKKKEMEDTEKSLAELLPQLTSLSPQSKDTPVVKFYEDYSGVRSILEDVIASMHTMKEKKYVVFSSSAIRPYLYHKSAFPTFTEERIKRKIFVRTIASGEGGGTQGKDERKWLTKDHSSATYKLIYANKVAMISINKNNIPHGLIIEDSALYTTELSIFNSLWEKL